MADAPALDQATLQKLREHLNAATAAAAAASPAAAAPAAALPGAPANFCSLWAQIKPILLAILGVIGFINPGLAAAIKALVAMGDQVCGVKT